MGRLAQILGVCVLALHQVEQLTDRVPQLSPAGRREPERRPHSGNPSGVRHHAPYAVEVAGIAPQPVAGHEQAAEEIVHLEAVKLLELGFLLPCQQLVDHQFDAILVRLTDKQIEDLANLSRFAAHVDAIVSRAALNNPTLTELAASTHHPRLARNFAAHIDPKIPLRNLFLLLLANLSRFAAHVDAIVSRAALNNPTLTELAASTHHPRLARNFAAHIDPKIPLRNLFLLLLANLSRFAAHVDAIVSRAALNNPTLTELAASTHHPRLARNFAALNNPTLTELAASTHHPRLARNFAAHVDSRAALNNPTLTELAASVQNVRHSVLHQSFHQLRSQRLRPFCELERCQDVLWSDRPASRLPRSLRLLDLFHEAVDLLLQRLVDHQRRALPRVDDLIDGDQLLEHDPALERPLVELVCQPLAAAVAVAVADAGIVVARLDGGRLRLEASHGTAEPVPERGRHPIILPPRHRLAVPPNAFAAQH